MMLLRRRSVLLTVAAACAAAAAGVGLAIAGGSTTGTPTAAQPPHRATVAGLDSNITRNLGVFRTATGAQATANSTSASSGSSQPAPADRATTLFGLNQALARQVTTGLAGQPLSLVPGNGYICVTGGDVGTSCVSDDELNKSRPQVDVAQCGRVPQGQIAVSGIAPDGVSALAVQGSTGAARAITITNNAFFAVVPIAGASGPPTGLTWKDSSGQVQRLDLQLPPDTATVKCGPSN